MTVALTIGPEPYHFACECGADRYCRQPSTTVSHEEWSAFWQKHPRRAGIRPLRVEAAMRAGGYDMRGTGHDVSEVTQ